jgi:hypothetical protein
MIARETALLGSMKNSPASQKSPAGVSFNKGEEEISES